MKTIHVVHFGYTLCGIEIPQLPSDHEWIYGSDWDGVNDLAERRDIKVQRCALCDQLYASGIGVA